LISVATAMQIKNDIIRAQKPKIPVPNKKSKQVQYKLFIYKIDIPPLLKAIAPFGVGIGCGGFQISHSDVGNELWKSSVVEEKGIFH